MNLCASLAFANFSAVSCELVSRRSSDTDPVTRNFDGERIGCLHQELGDLGLDFLANKFHLYGDVLNNISDIVVAECHPASPFGSPEL